MTIPGYVPAVGERDLDKIIRSIRNLYENAPDSMGVSSIASNTGDFTLSHGITNSSNDIRLNVGHLPGETSTADAAAGEIGEYKESIVAVGAAVSLSSATPANVTFLGLTGGDWDVTGQVYFLFGSSTSGTIFQSSLSFTSATIDSTAGRWNQYGTNTALAPGALNETFGPVGPLRISTATTTVYLVAQSTFTVSTMKAWGIIRARRIR